MPPRTKNASVKRKRTNDDEALVPSNTFHSGYFTNLNHSILFKEDLSLREFCPSYVLDLNWFRGQKGFDFIHLLEKHKLLNFLTMKGSAAPNFVKAFYTTLNYNYDSEILSFVLKGTKVNLTLAQFGAISHLPYEGDKLTQEGLDTIIPNRPDSWSTFDYHEAYASICHPLADPTKRPLLANSLSTRMRLLLYAVSRNICPKNHNCASVNFNELVILWGMKNEKKINWANLVIGHMLRCRDTKGKDLPYVVLITKILRHCNIPFLGEKIMKEEKICHIFGRHTIGQMRLKLVGESWQSPIGPASTREKDPNSPPSSPVPSPAPSENPPATPSSSNSLEHLAATLNTIKSLCETNHREILLSREVHSKELACLSDRLKALENSTQPIQDPTS